MGVCPLFVIADIKKFKPQIAIRRSPVPHLMKSCSRLDIFDHQSQQKVASTDLKILSAPRLEYVSASQVPSVKTLKTSCPPSLPNLNLGVEVPLLNISFFIRYSTSLYHTFILSSFPEILVLFTNLPV